MQTHSLKLLLIRDKNYFFTSDPATVIVSMVGLIIVCRTIRKNFT